MKHYKTSNHLSHAFGRPRKNHKYIARVMDGNRMRYFYDIDEYRAYRQGASGGFNRPHSRTPKYESGTAQVYARKPTASDYRPQYSKSSSPGTRSMLGLNVLHTLYTHTLGKEDDKPTTYNRPHSRKVKVEKGSVKVTKGKKVRDVLGSPGQGSANSLLSAASRKKRDREEAKNRKYNQKQIAKAEEEASRKKREEQKSERKKKVSSAHKTLSNHIYKGYKAYKNFQSGKWLTDIYNNAKNKMKNKKAKHQHGSGGSHR